MVQLLNDNNFVGLQPLELVVGLQRLLVDNEGGYAELAEENANTENEV